jgi:hypothetical protein
MLSTTMADPVGLTTVPNELEAEMICSVLRDAGIKCFWRAQDPAVGFNVGSGAFGAHEVLVNPEDLEAAREVLESVDETKS